MTNSLMRAHSKVEAALKCLSSMTLAEVRDQLSEESVDSRVQEIYREKMRKALGQIAGERNGTD